MFQNDAIILLKFDVHLCCSARIAILFRCKPFQIHAINFDKLENTTFTIENVLKCMGNVCE